MSGGFLYLIEIRTIKSQIGEKIFGFRNIQEKLEEVLIMISRGWVISLNSLTVDSIL